MCLAAADCLFEEVTPAALLDDRPCENGTRDFLVQWSDGAEDSWVRPRSALSCALSRHRCLKSAAQSFAWFTGLFTQQIYISPDTTSKAFASHCTTAWCCRAVSLREPRVP